MELVDDSVKIYKPGDSEFDKIAKTIAPINLVRKGLSQENNSFYAEIDPVANANARRKETVD